MSPHPQNGAAPLGQVRWVDARPEQSVFPEAPLPAELRDLTTGKATGYEESIHACASSDVA